VRRTFDGFFSNTDYVSILAHAFELRASRRKNYSIRAFARDLGIKPSNLSGVLRGVHGMSGELAREVSVKLGFTKRESDYFVALVESRHSRSKLAREKAKAKIQKLASSRQTTKLEKESTHFLSTWIYPAALELITLCGPKTNAELIAKKLKIVLKEAEQALAVLIQLRLVKETSQGLVRVEEHLSAVGNTPSATLRGFHKQIMDLGKRAIEEQKIENRKFMSATFSFDSKKTEEARAWLDEMYENFLNNFAGAGSSDSVNAVGIQFFRVDNEVSK
jgi:uncharacterized protein (TIGR02147 family)